MSDSRVSYLGVPLPAYAADEDAPPLTINGRLLSQVLSRTALGDPFPLTGLLEQETGEISGVAVDADGQPLAEHTVRATRVFTIGSRNSPATQVMGTTTTSTDGRFSLTELRASEYLVEVVEGDMVIASTSVSLAEGAMQVGGITVAVAPERRGLLGLPGAAWFGIGLGAALGIIYLALRYGQDA